MHKALFLAIFILVTPAWAHDNNVDIRQATLHSMVVERDAVVMEISGLATFRGPCIKGKCEPDTKENLNHVIVFYSRANDLSKSAEAFFKNLMKYIGNTNLNIYALSESDKRNIKESLRAWRRDGRTIALVVDDFGMVEEKK